MNKTPSKFNKGLVGKTLAVGTVAGSIVGAGYLARSTTNESTTSMAYGNDLSSLDKKVEDFGQSLKTQIGVTDLIMSKLQDQIDVNREEFLKFVRDQKQLKEQESLELEKLIKDKKDIKEIVSKFKLSAVEWLGFLIKKIGEVQQQINALRRGR